jgi:Carboxypeptidase regulatory-like domain/TonB dependent receptor
MEIRKLRNASLCVLILLGLSAMSGLRLIAQGTSGRILGTVQDQSGAVVVGATVTITDIQRGGARNEITDRVGEYVAAALLPGIYSIRVTSAGFKASDRPGIQVEVAQEIRIDFTLQAGAASQTVTVTDAATLLETVSSALGGTVSNETINNLPLNGRNYENLLQLRPGVVRYPGGGFSTTSTNGLRAEDNVYVIEGLYDSEPFSGQSVVNGSGIAGDSATILPIDAIQEFAILENAPAQYGWKPGAVVNVGLKSGTNTLHGTVYGFGRSDAFDARNYFNPVGTLKTPVSLEQYGTTAGGRIIKDKLFFFGGFEGLRYSVGNSYQQTSPATVSFATTGNPQGNPAISIPDAIAAVEAAGLPVSGVSQKLATLYPANSSGQGVITLSLPNSVTSENALGKIDYHINERNTMEGFYFFGQNSGVVEDAGQLQPQFLTDIHTRAQVVGVNWTFVPNSQWVNEARFGYSRIYQPTFTGDHNVDPSTYGINTGVTNPFDFGLPSVRIDGFTGRLGGGNWPKVQGPDEIYQVLDHVSHTIGKHALVFGGEVRKNSFQGGAYGGVRGVLRFGGVSAFPNASPLEDFFAGLPDQGQILSGDPTRHITNWATAVFGQDDYRVSKTLTLNLGLRYELSTVVKEKDNLLGNFDPSVGLVQVGKQISAPYNGDHKNFAPRFGFAWVVGGAGKTVVHGGIGLTYETLNWESFLAFNNTLGIGDTPTGAVGVTPGGGTIAVGDLVIPGANLNYTTAGPVFPTGTVNCSPTTGSPCEILAIDRNLTTPYVTAWQLNVQHQFGNHISLEAGYVGNHGSNLIGIRDINQVDPNSAAEINCGHCEQAGRPYNAQFPFLSFIYSMANVYRSNYNGLQATLTGRDYHGLSFVAGYTYAHALDDTSSNWGGGLGSGAPQNSLDPGAEYGNSDFDVRHRFTLSTSYEIPGRDGYLQSLKGWQLNGIVSLYSSQPWGPTDTGDDISLTNERVDRWDFFGKPSDFKSTSIAIPYFPGASNQACVAQATNAGLMASLVQFGCYAKGNSVMTPPALGTFGTMARNGFRDSGFKNVDFSVVKNWKFKERVTAQFRAEFFNVFNHPNFANPYGGQNGFGQNDPSSPGTFGCGCATPDVAATNPVIGSGGPRAMQLGMKLIY